MEKVSVECGGCESLGRSHKLQQQKQNLKWWNRCDSIIFAAALSCIFVTWVLMFLDRRLNESPQTPKHERKMACYYRLGNAGLTPASIPEDLCTHIIFSFATVDSDFRISVRGLGGANKLKRETSTLQMKGKRKVMVSVGGGGSGSDNFSLMAKDPNRLKIFLKSCSELLELTGLDGIDYDWEFPGLSERYALSRLLEWTRAMIDEIGLKQNRVLDLSVALPGPLSLSVGYSIDSLTRYCDFVNVMTYDLVLLNPLLKQTAFHNALYSQGIPYTPFSVYFSISFWLVIGIPRRMICLGIPTYGVSYRLADHRDGKLHSPVKGYSEAPGLSFNIAYARVCELANLSSAETTWSEKCKVPYMHDGRGNWVSFDNVRSVKEKVNFAARQGLGGVMIFSLNADDHRGKCGEGTLPLTRAAKETWI